MTHSTFEQDLSPERLARAATGHLATNETVRGRGIVYPPMAAAGLWTTPSDLARFAIELMRARSAMSNTLLSPDMARQMFTVHGYASENYMNQEYENLLLVREEQNCGQYRSL